MGKTIDILIFGILVLCTCSDQENRQRNFTADGNNIRPLQLSDFYPDFDDFKGEIKYFEWKSFRQLDNQFLKPDIEEWASSLNEIKKPSRSQQHIKAWFKDDKVRFFYLNPNEHSHGLFFAVNGDTIDFTTIGDDNSVGGITSQVGVGFWRYFYKDGRLRAQTTYTTIPKVYFKARREPVIADYFYGAKNYFYFDEAREGYLDSTEYKNKYGITIWDWYIDKERFDYSISGSRLWY